MKYRMNLNQLKLAINATGDVKLPIIANLSKIEKAELMELVKLIKAKRKN
ncbi:hypothetical protein [Flavobacterium sp.]|nr:hypothetical protein [Flavobacterium sp.]